MSHIFSGHPATELIEDAKIFPERFSRNAQPSRTKYEDEDEAYGICYGYTFW